MSFPTPPEESLVGRIVQHAGVSYRVLHDRVYEAEPEHDLPRRRKCHVEEIDGEQPGRIWTSSLVGWVIADAPLEAQP